MRKGVLLAEQNPESLISQLNAITLEEVFLKLSIIQNLERGRCTLDDLKPSTSLASTSQINKSVGISSAEIEEFKEGLKEASLYRYTYDQEPTCNISEVSSKKMSVKKENLAQQAYSYYRMSCKHDHVKAVMWKNYLYLTAHLPILLFGLIMPTLQLVLFFMCIGQFPVDLRVATFNHESNNYPDCNTTLYCNSTQLSCAYFAYLEKRGLKLVSFK